MYSWNRERKRTRDRLLGYNFCVVLPRPHCATLPMLYPWENLSQQQLAAQIILIAKANGYTGDEADFWRLFSERCVVFGTLETFPEVGGDHSLYFDTDTEILYHFKAVEHEVSADTAALLSAEIVGYTSIENSNEVITNMYIPIRSLLIEDTILNAGTADEYQG